MPAPGAGTPASSEGAPPFAQALDKASAQQRAATRDSEGVDSSSQKAEDRKAQARAVAKHTQAHPGHAAGAARRPASTEAAAHGVDPLACATSQESAVTDAVSQGVADEPGAPPEPRDTGDLAAWLAGLALPRADGSRADATVPGGRQARGDGGGAGLDPEGPVHTPRAALRQDVVSDMAQAGASTASLLQVPQTGAAVESRSAAEAAVHAAGLAPDAAAPKAGLDSGSALPAASTASAAGATLSTSASSAAATAFRAELHAALGSQEFAPALGTMLSVLVRDGIEHAQLRINPADMGPIEVRIRLDGSQAQVDFSAAQANTRQVLQDAVPALAGALRESGLTLTGGGVFEQPREQGGQPQARGEHAGLRSGEAPPDSLAPLAAAPRMPQARGVVDLYA